MVLGRATCTKLARLGRDGRRAKGATDKIVRGTHQGPTCPQPAPHSPGPPCKERKERSPIVKDAMRCPTPPYLFRAKPPSPTYPSHQKVHPASKREHHKLNHYRPKQHEPKEATTPQPPATLAGAVWTRKPKPYLQLYLLAAAETPWNYPLQYRYPPFARTALRLPPRRNQC